MAAPDTETISQFARRSDREIMRITTLFAVGGALLEILGTAPLPAFVPAPGGFPMLWGLWIPLCFLTIPPIHYLCRRCQDLQQRIDALEARLQPPIGDGASR